jgi:hypothetical protein
VTPTQFAYSAFGLRLVSSRPLHRLTPISGETAIADLRIEFLDDNEAIGDPAGEALWYTTDILDDQGNPALRIWKGRSAGEYFIRYVNGLTFCLNSAITRVRVLCGQPMNHADVCSFLLGPVIGIALRMRGTTCLHASAVEILGSAVAFLGEMGAGKSTTAAIFARNGHAVLTDDIVALEKYGDAFFARSSYPFLNLLPDSMALVFGSHNGRCSPDTEIDTEVEKTQLMLDGRGLRFESRLLALDRVYILERASEAAATTILPVPPREALIELSSQTYANKILDQQMRAREFQMLGELVKNVVVRRLIAPANAPEIDNLYRTVIQDFSSSALAPAH